MLPLIKHPTKFIFVDDDLHFIKPLADIMQFSLTPSLKEYYCNPVKALSDLNNFSLNTNLDKCLKYSASGQVRTEHISVQIAPLLQDLYSAERFSRISFVFADQKMPQMDGLDFLDRIKLEKIIKVLITSTITPNEAILEFNKKRINGFFDKDTSLFKNLENFIATEIDNYFLNLTHDIQSLFNKSSAPFSAFEDRQFELFFKGLLVKENIIEYYAIEEPGSCLLIDNKGNKKILWVKTKAQQESLIDLIDVEKLDTEKIKAIKNGQLTITSLCDKEFFDDHDINVILRPASLIESHERYSIAMSNDISCLKLNEEKIVTFSKIRPERLHKIDFIF